MEQVLKVDKDSPDRSLFDRFKAKLNSGDDISLRISSESRGLGKGRLCDLFSFLHIFFYKSGLLCDSALFSIEFCLFIY